MEYLFRQTGQPLQDTAGEVDDLLEDVPDEDTSDEGFSELQDSDPTIAALDEVVNFRGTVPEEDHLQDTEVCAKVLHIK